MEDQHDGDREPAQPRAVIKRRWAIVRRASGGAAVVAVAGAITLGDPTDRGDPGQEPAGGDSHISAEA